MATLKALKANHLQRYAATILAWNPASVQALGKVLCSGGFAQRRIGSGVSTQFALLDICLSYCQVAIRNCCVLAAVRSRSEPHRQDIRICPVAIGLGAPKPKVEANF